MISNTLSKQFMHHYSDNNVSWPTPQDLPKLVTEICTLISPAGFEHLSKYLCKSTANINNNNSKNSSNLNTRFLMFLAWMKYPFLQIPDYPSTNELDSFMVRYQVFFEY